MNDTNILIQLGWSDYFENQFLELTSTGFEPARVTVQNKNNYLLISKVGELTGEVSGKMLYEIDCGDSEEGMPAVGDWVGARIFENEQKAIIEKVLKRKTKFSRKNPGKLITEQVLAANIDMLFILTSLNEEFSSNRLLRYAILAKEGNVEPVFILTKSDLCDVVMVSQMLQVVKSEIDCDYVYAISINDDSWKQIINILSYGKTAALTGSSGVGKSSLLNKIMGEVVLDTCEISGYKSRGRHTTVRRELFTVPGGACIIDTPGLREVGLWSDPAVVDESFSDIKELENKCRFSDCSHTSEPGCAVDKALENGVLDKDYYESYLKLHREVSYYARKADESKMRDERAKWKRITKDARTISELKRKFR